MKECPVLYYFLQTVSITQTLYLSKTSATSLRYDMHLVSSKVYSSFISLYPFSTILRLLLSVIWIKSCDCNIRKYRKTVFVDLMPVRLHISRILGERCVSVMYLTIHSYTSFVLSFFMRSLLLASPLQHRCTPFFFVQQLRFRQGDRILKPLYIPYSSHSP